MNKLIIDFIIGALLMNAMPHFILGITKTRFLGLFGFSPTGNIAYAVLQFCVCVILIHINYNVFYIFENGMVLGSITVLVLFFIFGKFILRYYNKNTKNKY